MPTIHSTNSRLGTEMPAASRSAWRAAFETQLKSFQAAAPGWDFADSITSVSAISA